MTKPKNSAHSPTHTCIKLTHSLFSAEFTQLSKVSIVVVVMLHG